MRDSVSIIIIPSSELGLDEFELLTEIMGSDKVFEEAYEEAYEVLKDYIEDNLIERGLDTTIVPDDLNDFKVWIQSISDWVDDYIEYYAGFAVFEAEKNLMPIGYKIVEGQVDRKTEEAIEEIFRKNVYFEEVLAGLKEFFGLNITIDKYDYCYNESYVTAVLILEDVIRYLEDREKK